MQIDFTVVIFVLAGFVIVLLGWALYLHIKIRRLLFGKDAKSLEDSIVQSQKELSDLKNFEKECLTYFSDLEKRLSRSVQAVETVRFNPFKGTGEGGNQSFSTTLLSERGDGVVISSMYSRDHVSIFSKPLIKFVSQYDLTEEERAVVAGAKEKLMKKN